MIPERPRRKRDAIATRKKLLEYAEKIFVEKGYADTRIDDIAEQAGINKRMLYVYFGSKKDVYKEVLKIAFGRLFEWSEQTLSAYDDPSKKAKEIVEGYFQFLQKNPTYVRLIGWETMNEGRFAGEILANLHATGLENLYSVLAKGIESGVFRKDLDVRKAVMSINYMCLGYFNRKMLLSSIWKEDVTQKGYAEETIKHITEIFFNGIRSEKAPA